VVALSTSILAAALMTWGILRYAKRRPVGTPVSWGEAMVGATYVYFLSFLAYGVIPHQWLSLAENELNWRADRMFFGPGEILKPRHLGGWFPFDVTYRTVSDSIAAVFYVVFLGAQIWLWLVWQNRGKKAEKKGAVVARSTYGRPLIKQG
jgi:hypothetical protein